MKKIYSIVLMAAALLVSTNVKAAVDVTDFTGLQEAIANASTEQTVINVKADIEMTAGFTINNGKDIVLNLSNTQLTSSAIGSGQAFFTIDNGKLAITGTGVISSNNNYEGTGWPGYTYIFSMIGSTDPNAVEYSVLSLGSGIVATAPYNYGCGLAIKNNNNCAYGVKVTIDGELHSKGPGMTINGNVNKTTGKVPEITITGKVSCSAENFTYNTPVENFDPNAIYAAGYGKWNITGTVTGALGIYVKAGDFTLDGATVIATGEYSGILPNGNGSSGCGDAIVYDSNKSYADHLSIHIVGDTKVTSENGYAIQELVTTGTKSKVTAEDFKIESGEFTGADDKGALSITAELGEDVKVNGTITGGTYNSDITEYLNNITGVITPVYNTETGKTTYVVADKPTTDPWLTSLIGATATSYVRLTGGGNIELPADNVEMAYLVMQGDANKVTIKNGQTMTVGEIVLGPNAVIDVLGGGKLVVKGKNGIVADANSNIKIAAQEGAMGQFFLDPTVASNKNPHATVVLTSTKAYKDGSKYIYERLGMPAFNGMTLGDVVSSIPASQVAATYWDDGWKVLNKTQKVDPFVGLAVTTLATAPGTVFNFPCSLMGNANADLAVAAKWSYFANSYMANVDLKTFAEAIEANVPGVAQGVYLDPQGKEIWNPVSLDDLKEGTSETKSLNPMQGFILNRTATAAAVVTINYETMVWPTRLPATSAKAARNRAMDENLTRVKITITNEDGIYDYVTLRQSDKYTAELDKSGDMEKYINAVTANIYAVSNELGNMAQIATDNIDGLILGVSANKNEACKMTFSHVCGEQMAIRDNLTGATITMVEGAEYFFTAAEGDNANRFEIVAVKNAPTDVETVVETTGAKAVYTVLGQYVGTTDNWSILPAGIYVIDGVKMVK